MAWANLKALDRGRQRRDAQTQALSSVCTGQGAPDPWDPPPPLPDSTLGPQHPHARGQPHYLLCRAHPHQSVKDP